MRIGFDFRMGGSINSGIGRYVFELLKQVLKNDDKNEYFIFYNKFNVDEEDLKKLSKFSSVTLVATSIRHYSLMEQLLLPRILKKYNLDLVHHKISGHKKSHWLHFQAYKYIIQKAAERADKIITVTHFAKTEIVNFL